MNVSRDEIVKKRIEEIEQQIFKFKEQFESGTSKADNFMTMHEIEQMWYELQKITNKIYTHMLQDLLNGVDERELIIKKKENIKKME